MSNTAFTRIRTCALAIAAVCFIGSEASAQGAVIHTGLAGRRARGIRSIRTTSMRSAASSSSTGPRYSLESARKCRTSGCDWLPNCSQSRCRWSTASRI